MSVSTLKTSPLKNLRVAAPCSANWDDMEGDERTRHCAQCKLNVFNLSDMSQAEAEALIKNKIGRLCVRFFQREDGTIITDNCPVGLRALRNRLAWISAGLAAGFFFAASGALAAWGKLSGTPERAVPEKGAIESVNPGAPLKVLTTWAKPPVAIPSAKMIQGDVCYPVAVSGKLPTTPAPVVPVPSVAPVAGQ